MEEMFPSEHGESCGADMWEALAGFVIKAGFSGRRGALTSPKKSLTSTVVHAEVVKALDVHIRTSKNFWRGERHGGLSRSERCSAYADFFQRHVGGMASKLQTRARAVHVSHKNLAVRQLCASLEGVSHGQ